MTTVKWSKGSQRALERVHGWLLEMGAPVAADHAIEEIFLRVSDLATVPELGQPKAEMGPHFYEMSVPFGSAGYAVLYRYEPGAGEVVVLNVKHYREAGYT